MAVAGAFSGAQAEDLAGLLIQDEGAPVYLTPSQQGIADKAQAVAGLEAGGGISMPSPTISAAAGGFVSGDNGRDVDGPPGSSQSSVEWSRGKTSVSKQWMIIGDKQQGALTIKQDASATIAGGMHIGRQAGSQGYVAVDNANLEVGGKGVTVGGGGTGGLSVGDGGKFTTTNLTIGNEAGGQGTVSLSGGAAASVSGVLDVGQTGTGKVAIGQGANLNVGQYALVGGDGRGSLDIAGQAVVGTELLAGEDTGSSGDVKVDGRDAILNVNGPSGILMGHDGKGSMELSNGAKVTAEKIRVGDFTNGAGEIDVGSGAQLQAGGTLDVGGGGDAVGGSLIGSGYVRVSGTGSKVSADHLNIGIGPDPSGYGKGAAQAVANAKASLATDSGLDVTDGGQADFAQGGAIGGLAGKTYDASGSLVASGHGVLTIGNIYDPKSGKLIASGNDASGNGARVEFGGNGLTVNRYGRGEVYVDEGGTLSAQGLTFGAQGGNAANTAGLLKINSGGTAEIAGPIVNYEGAQATLQLNGGTLKTDADLSIATNIQLTRDQGSKWAPGANGQQMVREAGNGVSTIDTNGHSVTIGDEGVINGGRGDGGGDQPGNQGIVSGAGDLQKTGKGTLTLDAANTYTGLTYVGQNGGTLALGQYGSISDSAAVIVGDGGMLDLSSAHQIMNGDANNLSIPVSGDDGRKTALGIQTTVGARIKSLSGKGEVELGSSVLHLTDQTDRFGPFTGHIHGQSTASHAGESAGPNKDSGTQTPWNAGMVIEGGLFNLGSDKDSGQKGLIDGVTLLEVGGDKGGAFLASGGSTTKVDYLEVSDLLGGKGANGNSVPKAVAQFDGQGTTAVIHDRMVAGYAQGSTGEILITNGAKVTASSATAGWFDTMNPDRSATPANGTIYVGDGSRLTLDPKAAWADLKGGVDYGGYSKPLGDAGLYVNRDGNGLVVAANNGVIDASKTKVYFGDKGLAQGANWTALDHPSSGHLVLVNGGKLIAGGNEGIAVNQIANQTYKFEMGGGILQDGSAKGQSLTTSANITLDKGTFSEFDTQSDNGTAHYGTTIGNQTVQAENDSQGVISGAGALGKTGAGTLHLQGKNTYSGGTLIEQGEVAGHAFSFGSGMVEVAQGALLHVAQNSDYNFQNYITGGGAFEKTGSGNITLRDVNSYGGGTWIQQGSLTGTTTSFGTGAIYVGVNASSSKAPKDASQPGLGDLVSHDGLSTQTHKGQKDYSAGMVIDQNWNGDFKNDVSGDSGSLITKEGSGTVYYSGNGSGYQGSVDIKEGAVVLQQYSPSPSVRGAVGDLSLVYGSLQGSDILVDRGATLAGAGITNSEDIQGTKILGQLNDDSRSISVPGTRVISIQNEHLALESSSHLEAYLSDVYEKGSKPMDSVGGVASIQNGAALKVAAAPTALVGAGETYWLIHANGSIDRSGKFTSVDSSALEANHALVTVDTITYDPNDVYVNTILSDPARKGGYGYGAHTRNERAAGYGLDQLDPLVDPDKKIASTPLGNAVIKLGNEQRYQALDALSGEIYASARAALVQDSFWVRKSVFDRLDSTEDGVLMAPGMKTSKAAAGLFDKVTLWQTAYGSLGHNSDSSGNVARLRTNSTGTMMGADGSVGKWRLGGMIGYGRSIYSARSGRGSSAHSNNVTIGMYTGRSWGALNFRAGAAYTWNLMSTSRSISMADYHDHVHSSSRGGTAQGFGELGYKFKSGRLHFEPFANAAYVNLQTNGFSEHGGQAALKVKGMDNGVTFSTFGFKAATMFKLGEAEIIPHAIASYRHGFGRLTPTAWERFRQASGAWSMNPAGTPISANAAVVDVGANAHVTKRLDVGFSYIGQYGNHSTASGGTGHLTYRW